MRIKLDQDQETAIRLCSKQNNQNHEQEEYPVLLYPYKGESGRPIE